MRVISEEALLDYLKRCNGLSAQILPHLSTEGSQPVAADIEKRYRELIAEIHKHKREDSVLSDESWEWIWEVRPGINHLQVYGRLAWLNYNLFDLL